MDRTIPGVDLEKVEDTEEAMRAMKEQLHLSLVGLVDFRLVGRLISV